MWLITRAAKSNSGEMGRYERRGWERREEESRGEERRGARLSSAFLCGGPGAAPGVRSSDNDRGTEPMLDSAPALSQRRSHCTASGSTLPDIARDGGDGHQTPTPDLQRARSVMAGGLCSLLGYFGSAAGSFA